jgi:hypothetical protein
MTRVILKRPQARREPVSSLRKAAESHLKPRLTHRLRLSGRLGLSPLINIPAGGWRRFGGPPPASCGGWWDQIGDRTRRPTSIVPRYGCLRSGMNNSVSRRPSALLRRLSRPTSLPGSIKRHLPDLAHPVLRDPRDHQRLVDPRLELTQGRNRAPGNQPVVGDVSLRTLDTRQFTIGEGGKSVL